MFNFQNHYFSYELAVGTHLMVSISYWNTVVRNAVSRIISHEYSRTQQQSRVIKTGLEFMKFFK